MGMDVAPWTGAHGLTSAKLEQHLPKEMQWEPQIQSQIKVKRKGEMNLSDIFHLTPCTQILGLPGGPVGLIPGLRRSPGGGHGNPLRYSCLENLMDRAAWRATVHGVTKSQT